MDISAARVQWKNAMEVERTMEVEYNADEIEVVDPCGLP